jgi:hypothetical protein
MQPIKAYDILLRRQINEDRILGERTGRFLLATSFLFLAFVALLGLDLANPIFDVLRILLPIVGIFLTFVLYGVNLAAVNAVDFWHIAEYKIEEEADEFKYMRDNEITPHLDADKCIWGGWKWRRNSRGRWVLVRITNPLERLFRYPILWIRHEVRYLFPIFLALWVAALVVAIIIAINYN